MNLVLLILILLILFGGGGGYYYGGPMMGGGIGGIVIVDGVSFLLAVGTLLAVAIPQPAVDPAQKKQSSSPENRLLRNVPMKSDSSTGSPSPIN